MKKQFTGRPVLPGNVEGEARVSRKGFNIYASFFTSIHIKSDKAICADGGNKELFGKELAGKIICLPKTVGTTSGGAVWQRLINLGNSPIAVLFSEQIDSLAAGGLIVADIWTDKRIYVIDQLGDEFLDTVKNNDRIKIHQDGSIMING
ncbi:MAG TPA: DUF126 domain-containing protein [Desulfobacterales bacterium]|nr:DUF126 domain-containing protein [Desulfobacterales bacterium]